MNFKSLVPIMKASLLVACAAAGPLASLLDAQNGCLKYNFDGKMQGLATRSSPDCVPGLCYVTSCNGIVYDPTIGGICGAGDENQFVDSCEDWVFACACDVVHGA